MKKRVVDGAAHGLPMHACPVPHCMRRFADENALWQHLRSKRDEEHRETSCTVVVAEYNSPADVARLRSMIPRHCKLSIFLKAPGGFLGRGSSQGPGGRKSPSYNRGL